jgi:hypothetical protein
MAPVAGGVADTEKNGFVFFFGTMERFLSPGIPIHWIMSVLQKIRAGLMNQPIRMSGFHAKLLKIFITIELKNNKENPIFNLD